MTPKLVTAILAAALLGACGGTQTAEPYGRGQETTTIQPLDLPLRDPTGAPIDLADFRGRFLLLFLFATFDLTSQAALEPLQEVAAEHSEMSVLAIALQPDARELLPIFAAALNVEIPLAYDPDNRVLQGLTDIGQVAGVPTYVLVGRDGLIVRQMQGPLSAPALKQWCGLD